jgi:hypothetical protein
VSHIAFWQLPSSHPPCPRCHCLVTVNRPDENLPDMAAVLSLTNQYMAVCYCALVTPHRGPLCGIINGLPWTSHIELEIIRGFSWSM